jgi:hypothetical protein
MIRAGSGASVVVPAAIELCKPVAVSETWDRIASVGWASDREHCRRWFVALLAAEPPVQAINGFWFGIFNPVRAGEAASDFYVTGSQTFPSDDWLFDTAWRPVGRYAQSPAQALIYRLGAEGGDDVLAVADYVLTFAHAAGTVNDFIEDLGKLLHGGASSRAVAVGHDSGDAMFLGTLTAAGMDRSSADWI